MMDCTQILDDLAFDEPTEIKADKKIQFGSLEIGGKSYPIYKGENRIGRDSEACSVFIDNKALSKEHAVIDVADFDNHHLYDLSSTNKTRMGKLVLQPFIRYNIQDQATIIFADTRATYHKISDIADIDVDESKSSSPTQNLEDLDTQIEGHYENEKLKPAVSTNNFADNIYEAPTQCEDFESDALNQSGKYLTSVTTSALKTGAFPLSSNDTNKNKSVSNEIKSEAVLEDQSYDRSLLEGDEDMFQMSVSGSEEVRGAEKEKSEASEPTCNQQEEKTKFNSQQLDPIIPAHTTGHSSVPCTEKSFKLDFSSGDETDPEDIFCAQTQKFPVLKSNLETNMGDTLFSKPRVSLTTGKSKISDAAVVEDKKAENISISLMHDTSINEQQVEGNSLQSNFSKSLIEHQMSTLPLQKNDKQETDPSSKEVASGDETDPEELFCAPTQKFCATKEKSSPDEAGERDLEELCDAPTQKIVCVDSKKDHETPVSRQSEHVDEAESDVSDTTLEDVICPATQETRRMGAEMEINETPERDPLVHGHSGIKLVIKEATVVLKQQDNENNQIQPDLNSDELFCAPTQKIDNFYDLSKGNKTDKTKTQREKAEFEEHPKLITENKSNGSPELLKESLQNSVVTVASKLEVGIDVYSQPTQRVGEWNEEQQLQDNIDSACNRSKINKERDLKDLFSQPTQLFCASSTKDKITNKQKCAVEVNDTERSSKGVNKKMGENKSGNASPSVIVFENVRGSSSDVSDIANIGAAHDTDDIFSCPTQKLDAGLNKKHEIGLAAQLPTVSNKYDNDIFSADTQDFPLKTIDSLKTESMGVSSSLRESGSKAAHIQHSTKGGVDGSDDSLSGEDEEVIKIFSKAAIHQREPNCEVGKNTKNTLKQGKKCITAGVSLTNIVDSTTECRENDEDSLEMELHLPQSQEVKAALKELENKVAPKTISKEGGDNMENNFSSPVIPRKRKSKAAGTRKQDTIQESTISENVKPLYETPISTSKSEVCDLEANSSEKRRVRRQHKDEHIKKSPNLAVVQSSEIVSVSREQNALTINNLPASKDSGSRRSVREKKKTWKLAETTDSTSPGLNKSVENAANRPSENKLHDSVAETTTGKAPVKRHSRLKKTLITAECNTVNDLEVKKSSKKSIIKNIGEEDGTSSVPNENQQEKNPRQSGCKNLEKSDQEQATKCEKNDGSVSVDLPQSECKTTTKFKETHEGSKQTSGRSRRSRITSISNLSEGIRFQEEERRQNVAKACATRQRNPSSDKGNSSNENIGPKSRKSKHSTRASRSEASIKSPNRMQIKSKHVAGKINSSAENEASVDHQNEPQSNGAQIPQTDEKQDTSDMIPEVVEENSSVEKRTSKRKLGKLDNLSSRRNRNTKDTNQSPVGPTVKVHKELSHDIALDIENTKGGQPQSKKRKVTLSNVDNNEPLRKDIPEENSSRAEERDIKGVKIPRGRKTGTEQLKSAPNDIKNKNNKSRIDSPKSQEYKNVPATTRKRRAVSEITSSTISENKSQNLIVGPEELVFDHGKTTKYDSSVKKPKTSLPVSLNKHMKSVELKDSSDSSMENNDKSPRASHRLSARPAKTTHQVLFTGLNDPKLQSTVQNLGGKIMEKPEDCNVLVTDKVRRTYKFLCVMGQGKPIVSPDWLLKSQKIGRFLDPWEFLLNDKESEKKFRFNLKTSLMQCGKAKLLTGFSVAVTPSVKPPPQEMKGIVESCGGTFIEATKKLPGNSFIISCNEDKHMWPKLKKLGSPLVGTEVLLLGVLQQKLNLNTYTFM